MKRQRLPMIMVLVLIALAASGAAAQDLSARKSIFFTGTDTKSNYAAEVAAQYSSVPAPGVFRKTPDVLTIKTSQAIKCAADGTCEFNLGVTAWRVPAAGTAKDPLTATGRFTTDGGANVSGPVNFKYSGNSDLETFDFIMPVKMKVGKNQVTFAIDPENKVTENDESNNRFSVIFNVELSSTILKPSNGNIPPVTTGPGPKLIALPDLTITHLDNSHTGWIVVTIRNDCIGASAPTTVRLDVYKTIEESSGILRSTNADVPVIQPNAEAEVKLLTGEHGEISTISIDHFLKVTVDPNHTLTESAEGNNSASIKGNFNSYPFPLKCGKP
jgi:hypothetical protein